MKSIIYKSLLIGLVFVVTTTNAQNILVDLKFELLDKSFLEAVYNKDLHYIVKDSLLKVCEKANLQDKSKTVKLYLKDNFTPKEQYKTVPFTYVYELVIKDNFENQKGLYEYSCFYEYGLSGRAKPSPMFRSGIEGFKANNKKELIEFLYTRFNNLSKKFLPENFTIDWQSNYNLSINEAKKLELFREFILQVESKNIDTELLNLMLGSINIQLKEYQNYYYNHFDQKRHFNYYLSTFPAILSNYINPTLVKITIEKKSDGKYHFSTSYDPKVVITSDLSDIKEYLNFSLPHEIVENSRLYVYDNLWMYAALVRINMINSSANP